MVDGDALLQPRRAARTFPGQRLSENLKTTGSSETGIAEYNELDTALPCGSPRGLLARLAVGEPGTTQDSGIAAGPAIA